FYALEDDYAFHLDKIFPLETWGKKQSTIMATALIVIGVAMLWDNVMNYLHWLIPSQFYWAIVDDVPQVFVGVLLILGGLYLIRGKKRELEQKEEKWEDML
ncbi:MAG: hypothetical protein K1V96_09295, partial [Lachnospiraceae bacterium]